MAANSARLRLAEVAVDKPDYADPLDVEAFAKDLPDEFLLCRELGHNWLPYGIPGRYRDGGYQRVLRCNRCKTERHIEISNRGVVTASQYKHPDGYLLEGLGRIVGEGRGVLRLASITRERGKDRNAAKRADTTAKKRRTELEKKKPTKLASVKPDKPTAKKPAVKKPVAKKTAKKTVGRK